MFFVFGFCKVTSIDCFVFVAADCCLRKHCQFQEIESEPMLCRGLQLERQTADFLVAGLLEGMPFHLSDPVVMSTIAGTCSLMVVSFSMDRASANLAALRYFWQRLIDPQMPTSIFPHAGPCCAHGVALVKTTPRQGKQIVAVAHTFTSSMRQWKFVDA